MFLKCSVILILFFTLSIQDRPPEQYRINLDLSPYERWQPIFLAKKEFYRNSIQDAVSLVLSQPEISKLKPLILKIADVAETLLPQEMAEEIKGISAALDVETGDIVLENILYDVTAFGKLFAPPGSSGSHLNGKLCTSIVAEDHNGMIWHGRNLDYGNEGDFVTILKNITMNVDFVKGDEVVYKATTYAGLTGLFTAQKSGAFTLSLNERDQGYAIENILVDILYANATLTGHLLRQVVDKANSFEEAVELISSAKTAAPSYVILGGTRPGEGVVITRNRLEADDLWRIDTQRDRWFVLETNYDHWKPPPSSDDRRDPGFKAMAAMGRSNVTKENLFQVLSTKPVLNSHTTYTTIMSAVKPDLYQTWIRET